MIIPELKTLMSPDLERPTLPDDVDDCTIAFEATVGSQGSDAADIFAFTVVTPTALARETRSRWGSGLLIVPTFSWEIIDLALARLLAGCSRPSWTEFARELHQNLHWEFADYREQNRA